jgi:protein gp37
VQLRIHRRETLQKTLIEWCVSPDGSAGWTWNPVTGCYGPGGSKEHPKHCPDCYARALVRVRGLDADARNFVPTLHEGRLDGPRRRRKPTTFFVCSMADLWGEWVPSAWIRQVLQVALTTPRHRFIFLTKNPQRYREFTPYAPNVWIGATVRNEDEYAYNGRQLAAVQAPVRFVSAEPLLAPYSVDTAWRWVPDWLIVGDLNRRNRPTGTTQDEWVQRLTDSARARNVPVFHKDSLTGRGWRLRQFPAGAVQLEDLL